MRIITICLVITFFSCQQKNNNKDSQFAFTKSEGKRYAVQVKRGLGKELMKAINEKGTSGALSYCNFKALSITDSLSAEFGVSIKRVSDKNRNPFNKASDQELDHINFLKKEHEKGKVLAPKITNIDGKTVAYYPILTNGFCLQCHGTKDVDIDSVTSSKIEKLYPKDLATGYVVDEVRGLWVVEKTNP